MKRIYSVNDSKVVLGTLDGLKSRITTYLPRVYHVITPMLFVAFGLFGVNESAWGNDATIANKGTSVTADGITFSLTGTHKIEWGLERYAYLSSGESFSLSWSVPTGYTISVSQVDIETYNAKSWGTTGNGQYKTTKLDSYTQFCKSNSWGTRTLNSSSYFPLGNGASISIKAVDKEMQYKSIKFYYTKAANSHVITLDNETPTTAGSKSVTLTFDSKEHADITNPQKTNYTFAGWYSGDNGTGSLVIDANGNLQANVDGYTGANGVWKKDATTTLHAKWILNSKTITLDNQSATTAGTTSLTVYYNQNTNLTATPAITVPGRTGYTFEGYYTATNGGGLQLIAKNGNVNASVAGYTDANKKWIYDGNKTLYAYWKQNQTITWNGTLADKIRSKTVTLSATASSNLTVTYTATSNAGTVSISGNTLTCLTAGSVTVTAHQAGNGSWNAATDVSKTFTIVEHAITKNPTATSITYEQALSNSTLSGGTANVDGSWSWKYPTSVPGAGTDNQIAVFTPSSSIISAYPLECEVSVTVAKATPDVTCNISNAYEVDDATLDLQTLWTREGNGTITYSKVSFTQTGSNNDDATTPAITNNRYLSLGQAGNLRIQMAIAEGSNYVARTVTKDITINKKSNALTCSWGSWSKDMNVDSQTGVTFSSNHTQTPIVVEQKSGNTEGSVIATYSSTNNNITSLYNIGEATWSVSQAENYKYEAAETKTLTVNVVKGSTTCYVLQDDAERSWSTIGSTTYGDGSVFLTANGQRLQFEVMRSAILGFTNNKDFSVKYSADGSNWSTLRNLNTLSNTDHWYDFNLDISGLTIKYIKFESETGATGSRHVRNVRITRKKWYKLEDKDGNEISSLTMPTNTLGGNHTTAKFTVDYSTCADQIKVVSNHPHIEVSPTSFTSGGDGTQEITVTYASDDSESIDGVITVYTPYDNKTINVHAETEKKTQEIKWSDLFAGETISLPQTFTSSDAAYATSKLPVVYISGNDEIIEVAADSLSFTVVGTGTTTLTALQKGNNTWKSVSDTKTINASNKKIQRIIWNQQFTRSLSVGNEIPLTATVSVLDVATGYETESNERSAEIVYTCPDANGVIEIFNGTNIRVLGYGNTTITASVAGNEEYEAASPVTLPVRVREIQTGDCDMPLVYEHTEEIEFFQMNTNEIIATPIAINHANGTPDKLSFDVRGAAWKLGIEYYKGSIQVQQSTDNKVNWSGALTTVSPAKGQTASSGEIQLDPNATHIRFVRPDGGQGYHYVGNIQITRLPYIRTEEATINLGNISMGETRNFTIPVSYCSVKGNMTVSKGYDDDGLTTEPLIEAECGDMSSSEVHASIQPTAVGPWSNVVTVRDPLSNMFLNVTVNATIQKGDQTITWNPTLDILTTEAPALNAVASSGLTVSYAVTSGNNTVARIDNGQVIILQPGQFTITASQGGNSNYNAAPSIEKTFTVTAETLTVIDAPTAGNITYGQTLSASTLTGGSAKDSKGNDVGGTFAWETGSTKPNASDDAQAFTVVFTPSENAEWYTNLTTDANINVAKADPAATVENVSFAYGKKAEEVALDGTGDGEWSWTDSRKGQVLAVDTYEMDVHFAPKDDANYNAIDKKITLTVTKANPVATANAVEITYGATAASVDLEGTGLAGEWTWTDSRKDDVLAAGEYTMTVHFVPTDAANYNEKDATVALTVNKATSEATPTAATITAGQKVSESALTNSGTEGTWVWDDAVKNTTPAAGTYNYMVHFTPDNANYTTLTTTVSLKVNPLVNEFTGEGDWNTAANWTNGIPNGDEPNVIVKGELIIDENVTVGSLTIKPEGGVTIIENGKLTVTGQSDVLSTYGDIHVKNDGALELENTAVLKVRNFTLDAKLCGQNALQKRESAASGQVDGTEQLTINGDVYFQISFDPLGKISYGWYDFTVPFAVNINDGIERVDSEEDKVMVSGVDFIIMEADEANRANGGNGWRKLNSGVLQPGKLYTITLDDEVDQNTLRFTWNGNGSINNNGASYSTQCAAGSVAHLRGWNGLGNGMLSHGHLATNFKKQVYNHGKKTYETVEDEKTFAVGTAFFIQVPETISSVAWNAAAATEERPLYAPRREMLTVDEFRLTLTAEEEKNAADQLWVSASEEATGEYVIGHDLVKMGTPMSAKVAQMWVDNNNLKLCDIEMPLVNDEANCSLGMFAPKAGSYELKIDAMPEDAALYLTYNDNIIWDLTASPYVFDLAKGTTNGYGLRIEAKHAPQVVTGIDSMEADGQTMRKVLIDNKVYVITPEGKMYDIIGKSVKY